MDLKEVKRIINMVEEANISSLAIEIEGIKIEIKNEYRTPTSRASCTGRTCNYR